ncbi:YlzJ-like protein [Paenibacillus cellulosilyticus]|uniref:YlzJ-like protein n=1 Tax=Paenibacillus cellulosilyticus TaxID=375489 RepID=A0A2V2YYF2_9BACL|nr:YlzJ-like family protein [Paenibacillus cellulosilyticus]PWW06456.1 YlzJ-like protein [Paenibacillus cellulosilyticus]QKS46199.1 YlzJ-like family protein [Paenibacillus cellulosilyticus]
MTLYTSMPLELVLAGMNDEREPLIELEQDGALMQLAPLAPGIGKLVRLVHAPLDHYLNPRFQPGAYIVYSSPTD